MADAENYFEAELLKHLHGALEAGIILVEADSAGYFSTLAQCYPVAGSKIRWSHIPGSIERHESAAHLQLAAGCDFFGEMVALHGLTGQAVHIGDSAVGFALLASVEEFARHLDALLSIPQHHYFVAADYSWCLALGMEGGMSFGRMVNGNAGTRLCTVISAELASAGSADACFDDPSIDRERLRTSNRHG